MIIGKTYFFRNKHNKVFIGHITSISKSTIVMKSYCDSLNQYVSDKSYYSIPYDWIIFYYLLSDLIEGNRYKFIDINNTSFEANLLSFSNYHFRLNYYNSESSINRYTMPIFYIKNIESI